MQTSKDVLRHISAVFLFANGLAYAATPLENNVAVTDLSTPTGETISYSLNVPDTDGPLTVSISGGSGDADLYLRFGEEPDLQNYDCRPWLNGNNETCSISAPTAGTYHIAVRAYRSFSDVSLIATFPEDNAPTPTVAPPGNAVITLQKAETLANQSGARAQDVPYIFNVPEGAINVNFKTNGGSGDADLYVKFASAPTTDDWDCRPFAPGNIESCNFAEGQAGVYHAMLRGYTDYAGVNITADYSTDNGGGGSGECELSALEQEFLNAHNAARAQSRSCGGEFFPAAPPLTWSCKLAAAATRHSNDMASNNFLDHTGSDGSSAGNRINDTGYSWSSWSENIAAGQTSVSSVMSSWLNSTNHCRNIMGTSRTEMGGALVETSSAQYGHYWTAVFARPQ